MVTQAQLKEVLHYDPTTGAFTWLVRRNSRVPAGSIAGGVDSKGYGFITITGTHYRAHRLAWLYTYGTFPVAYIDHVNRDRLDNRLDNLREATGMENAKNTVKYANNTSGFRGVNLHPSGKWRATGQIAGKQKHLGLFSTPEAASAAYEAFAAQHHGAFYHMAA